MTAFPQGLHDTPPTVISSQPTASRNTQTSFPLRCRRCESQGGRLGFPVCASGWLRGEADGQCILAEIALAIRGRILEFLSALSSKAAPPSWIDPCRLVTGDEGYDAKCDKALPSPMPSTISLTHSSFRSPAASTLAAHKDGARACTNGQDGIRNPSESVPEACAPARPPPMNRPSYG